MIGDWRNLRLLHLDAGRRCEKSQRQDRSDDPQSAAAPYFV